MKNFLYTIIFIFGLLIAQNAFAGIIMKPVFQAGLVGYWDFQEGAGNNVYDKSGQGNTGTWNGTGSHWANGKIGAGGNFNGSDDYVTTPTITASTITISAWVKTSSATLQIIIHDYAIGENNQFRLHSDGNVRFLTGGSSEIDITTTGLNVVDGNWHHVAAINDGTNAYIYVDGIQRKSGSGSTNQRSWNQIGTYVTEAYFNGLIDEVRIYNRALNAGEVERLYKSGATKIGAAKPVIEDNPSNAFIAYVRQNCTGYSPCYTSLDAWADAFGGIDYGICAPGNLVCAEKSAVAKIDGPWTSADTTAVLINGWNTDATHYIKIYTTASARHSGKWDDNKYRLVLSSGNIIDIDEDYVRIDGIQVKTTSTGGVRLFDLGTNLTENANEIRIQNVIGVGNPSVSVIDSQHGIYCLGQYVRLYVFNSIFYGLPQFSVSSVIVTGYDSTFVKAYNVTGIGSVYGFWEWAGGGEITVKNCYSGGGTYSYTNIPSGQKTTCASSDTGGSEGLQNIAANTNNFKNVTAGSEDFHIPVNSALKDKGTNTSGDAAPMNFTTDIDRQNRAGSWDIGADESIVTQVNSPQNNKVTDGLVGLWSFNGPDIDGTTATDRSGQGNNGTLYGSVRAIGKVGQALSFNGTSDYVDVSNIANDIDDGDLSISAWVKFSSSYGVGSPVVIVFRLGINLSTNDVDFGFGGWMAQSTDGALRIATWTGQIVDAHSTQTTWQANTWYHIAGTIVDNGKLKIYLNGSLVGSGDMLGSRWSDDSPNAAIARSYESQGLPGYAYFNGTIDEVRIYNRALTAQEILRLYNMGR